MIGLYAAIKFLAYSAWCYVGLRAARLSGPTAGLSLRLGAVRWSIGLLLGIAVFFAVGSIDADATLRTYVAIYTPVRIVEWAIMAILVARRLERHNISTAVPPLVFWCAGGIVVSFVTDMLSPEGLQGRFCVGRCLC